MCEDAETALAEDPEGFRRLHAVLHGPAGVPADRRLPTLAERFGVPTASKPRPETSGRAGRCRAKHTRSRAGHEC